MLLKYCELLQHSNDRLIMLNVLCFCYNIININKKKLLPSFIVMDVMYSCSSLTQSVLTSTGRPWQQPFYLHRSLDRRGQFLLLGGGPSLRQDSQSPSHPNQTSALHFTPGHHFVMHTQHHPPSQTYCEQKISLNLIKIGIGQNLLLL